MTNKPATATETEFPDKSERGLLVRLDEAVRAGDARAFGRCLRVLSVFHPATRGRVIIVPVEFYDAIPLAFFASADFAHTATGFTFRGYPITHTAGA